jgi:4'-phosphopantetheinyl transferase
MAFRIRAREQSEWENRRYGVGGQNRPGHHKLERGARGAGTALSSLLDKAVELRPGIRMPVFENDGLEVLAFMLDVEQDIIRRIGVCLSEEERRRAQGLRLEQDRRRFVVTRGQLRRVLASKLGISPSDVELEYGRLGKPHLSHRMPARDLRFSVSRSADVAVMALSTRQEVGVDIEAVLPVPEADEIAALCFSASEYESYTALGPEDRLEGFLRRWTRLEAISKALGCGLRQRISWDEKDWAVRSFMLKPGHIGSVVVRK